MEKRREDGLKAAAMPIEPVMRFESIDSFDCFFEAAKMAEPAPGVLEDEAIPGTCQAVFKPTPAFFVHLSGLGDEENAQDDESRAGPPEGGNLFLEKNSRSDEHQGKSEAGQEVRITQVEPG